MEPGGSLHLKVDFMEPAPSRRPVLLSGSSFRQTPLPFATAMRCIDKGIGRPYIDFDFF